MLRPRQQYRILQAAFVFVLIGVAFWGSYLGYRAGDYPAQPKADQNAHGVDYPSAVWHWLAHDAAGFFTAGLCVVTGLLAWFTYALYRTTAQLALETREASAAALKASTEATKLAREEFNATHRPEIVVHNFQAAHDDDAVGASFTVVNKGTADALIERLEGIIVPGASYLRPGIIPDDLNVAEYTLASGQHREMTAIFGTAQDSEAVGFEIGFGGVPTFKLWCLGRITYRDQPGRRRQMGFCRSYDSKRKIWTREPDSDYEYSY
jgi:hypothetical protein